MKISPLDVWTIAFAVVSVLLIAKAIVLLLERIWLMGEYNKDTENKFVIEEISRRQIPIRVNFFVGATLACIAGILQLS